MRNILIFLNFQTCLCFNFLTSAGVSVHLNRVLQTGTCYKTILSTSYSGCLGILEEGVYRVNVIVYERRYLLCKLCYTSQSSIDVQVAPGNVLVYHQLDEPVWSNLAVGKPSNQRSTYYVNDTRGYASSDLAVDGVWQPIMVLYPDRYSCASINAEPGHIWWMVNLEKIYPISKLDILTRKDCKNCDLKFNSVTVQVGETTSTLQVCNRYEGPAAAGVIVTIHCNNPMMGQYVRLSKPGTDVLSICEVGVYS